MAAEAILLLSSPGLAGSRNRDYLRARNSFLLRK